MISHLMTLPAFVLSCFSCHFKRFYWFLEENLSFLWSFFVLFFPEQEIQHMLVINWYTNCHRLTTNFWELRVEKHVQKSSRYFHVFLRHKGKWKLMAETLLPCPAHLPLPASSGARVSSFSSLVPPFTFRVHNEEARPNSQSWNNSWAMAFWGFSSALFVDFSIQNSDFPCIESSHI